MARRLVRLALAPGAFGYGLLAAVLILIWLGVGSPPAANPTGQAQGRSGAGQSTVPYRGPAPGTIGASALITLDDAISSVHRFTGEPRLKLEGGLEGDQSGRRTPEMYYLESVGPNRGEDFFKVDAHTAEVVEATRRSRIAATTPPIGLSSAEAERSAARFADQRFAGFDGLQLVDRSSRVADNNVLHSFKWVQVASESGAELPVSVSIAVSAGSGEIVWYLAQRDQLHVDPRPTVERGQAVRLAASGTRETDSRWDTSDPIMVRLQVLYDDDDQQQLVWSVWFRSRVESSKPSLRVLVNAHTGQLLAGAG